MSLIIKSFDDIVTDILNRLVSAGIGISNTTGRSVIRTMVESIAAEINAQYYQIQEVYNSYTLSDAVGEALDRLVAILGVTRNQGTKAFGQVVFYKTTAALTDISIPIGTRVSTIQDQYDNVYDFLTIEAATLLTGQTEVAVQVECSDVGSIFIASDQLSVLGDTVLGIEGVHNIVSISGGTDPETDVELRTRSRNAFAQLGKGTLLSVKSAVMAIDGIRNAIVNDMARGVGTADILILGDTMPLSQDILDKVDTAIADMKPAGIDIDVSTPTLVPIDVTVTSTVALDSELTSDQIASYIGNAIVTYFDILNIGDDLIVHQMIRYILSTTSDLIDISTTNTNVTASATQIITLGTITIDGSVWTVS
jgi:uncharacterized phage protein gp47/JayE